MNKNLSKAKSLLNNGATLAVINGGGELTFSDPGLNALLSLQKGSLAGAFVADKIVGKAAALLFARGGVIEVYAEVISEPALEVLKKRRILCIYEKIVPYILNKGNTAICPMENAVLHLEDPEAAYETLVLKTGFKF